jgi:hypothetical protein
MPSLRLIALFFVLLPAARPQLKFPSDYREWIFLSSGVGMTYGPVGDHAPAMFDNVFVNPEAYRAFLETGHWPEKAVFVLEVRTSETHASINHGGHFQRDIAAIEAEVKEGSKWTFYSFAIDQGKVASSGKLFPQDASCYSCHGKNTAVENTFVQFYPTLYEVAERKGTLKPEFARLPVTAFGLIDLIRKDGWKKGVETLDDTAMRTPQAAVLSEASLDMVGNRLLRGHSADAAVGILEWAVTRYPKSANTQDSLADAYLEAGRKEAARSATEKELRLAREDSSLTEAQRTQFENSARARMSRIL